MSKADDEKMNARRAAIFEAGAKAQTPDWPVVDGYRLGSMEACNFFDGHASTHPDFRNPYRGGHS
jgi:hypothetical protein